MDGAQRLSTPYSSTQQHIAAHNSTKQHHTAASYSTPCPSTALHSTPRPPKPALLQRHSQLAEPQKRQHTHTHTTTTTRVTLHLSSSLSLSLSRLQPKQTTTPPSIFSHILSLVYARPAIKLQFSPSHSPLSLPATFVIVSSKKELGLSSWCVAIQSLRPIYENERLPSPRLDQP